MIRGESALSKKKHAVNLEISLLSLNTHPVCNEKCPPGNYNILPPKTGRTAAMCHTLVLWGVANTAALNVKAPPKAGYPVAAVKAATVPAPSQAKAKGKAKARETLWWVFRFGFVDLGWNMCCFCFFL